MLFAYNCFEISNEKFDSTCLVHAEIIAIEKIAITEKVIFFILFKNLKTIQAYQIKFAALTKKKI